jgi:hypothetical protein
MAEAPNTHHSDSDSESDVPPSTWAAGPGRCRLVILAILELINMLEDNRITSLEEFWRQVNGVHAKYFITRIEPPGDSNRKYLKMLLEEVLPRVHETYKTDKFKRVVRAAHRAAPIDSPFIDYDVATDNDDTAPVGDGYW